jgi:peptidoglycan hydrolase-like protein with peptidoglycan-binding domain
MDGAVLEGTTTDAEGIERSISPLARSGTLTVDGHVWTLQLAALNPVDNTADHGVSGIQARLLNLGYDVGEVDGVAGPKTRAAIRAFQQEHRLALSGDLNQATRDKVVAIHGC